MITVMRKHHKVLMIFITVLVCISFSWYWNKTDFGEMGNGSVGSIYGRKVPQMEFQRNVRLLRLASQLGLRDLVTALTSGAQTENDAYDRFSWNLMILRHEAKQLGIQPTTSDIASAVKALPAFQGENGFDIARFTEITDRALAPAGFSEAQIEELASDQITLERIKKLLGTGVNIPQDELRTGYEQAFAKMDVTVVRFPSDQFAQDVQVSDDEIAKAYEATKAQLKSDEKRKVKFVQFGLTDEQKKLSGKPRIDVLQKLADQATAFTDSLQAKGADFDQAAAKFNLTPKETTEFAQSAPDPQLAATPQLAPAVFGLTKDSPNSDALQTKDGFVIMHLANIDPSHPLTLEEARPKLTDDLKKQKIRQATAAQASEVAGKLREGMKNGKAVAEVATTAGVKAEKLPPFALLDQLPDAKPTPSPTPKDEAPDMPYIKRTASSLKSGEVSEFVSTPAGGLIIVLEKRETIDPAQFAKIRPSLENRAMENKSQVVFYEWLRERRREAGVPEPKPETAPS